MVAISAVIFSLGRRPPLPGLAPWASLISIIFTCGSAMMAAAFSSSNRPSWVRQPNLAGPIWYRMSPPPST
jgi:hypothetical protein